MKGLIRSIIISCFAVWLISAYVGGISFSNDFRTLFLGALALSIGNVLILPLINLLLLPINILTLGSFRWFSAVFLLFIVTHVVSGFTVSAFELQAISTPFFSFPPLWINLFFAFILISFLLSLLSNFFFWLCE